MAREGCPIEVKRITTAFGGVEGVRGWEGVKGGINEDDVEEAVEEEGAVEGGEVDEGVYEVEEGAYDEDSAEEYSAEAALWGECVELWVEVG
jgi:hypothetical protein